MSVYKADYTARIMDEYAASKYEPQIAELKKQLEEAHHAIMVLTHEDWIKENVDEESDNTDLREGQ